MKKLFYMLILPVMFAACRKIGTDNTTSPVAIPLKPQAVNFNIKDQIVKISINNTTLSMNYYENVTLFVEKDSLVNAYAVIFNEDFSATQLKYFPYTMINSSGTYVYNYADNNLNNISLSAKTDTVVNNVAVTKMSFTRNFIFFYDYGNLASAQAGYNYLLTLKQTIGFSSYVSSPTTSSTSKTTANLLYVAQ